TDYAGTTPATSITARFGSGHSTQWQFKNGTYDNTNSNADSAGRFKPTTVIAVRVQVRDAGYTDPAGNFVPESVTTGSGNASIFHNGTVVQGTWSKAGPTKNWVFTDAAGAPLKIPAGHTWLEVMPVDAKGGSLTFK
ncbi:MAG: hypothetical protein JWO46_3047, partial [Nocardioidaceae bacterium]|nr:hypothetical protein [Nocardioidaceae bacterium]